jgi:hypothetical protein
MKKNLRASIMKYFLITVLITVLFVVAISIVGYVWIGSKGDLYRSLFADISPGMSKGEVVAVVGPPNWIDTTNQTYEIWSYSVPIWLFEEIPYCYFCKGDSILVRFLWEPIDLSLPGDSCASMDADTT